MDLFTFKAHEDPMYEVIKANKREEKEKRLDYHHFHVREK